MTDVRPGPDPARSGAGGRDRLAEAVEVMARIRRDGQWESAQTHASLLPYLVEESWELIDAVADGDRDELVAELGDLLLQVLFHSAIGAGHREQPFDIQDVAGSLLDKLRRRAPYWFDQDDRDDDDNAPAASTWPGPSTRSAPDAAEQDRLWQEAKAAERVGRPPRGVVEGLPWDMPALALGQKVLARARAAGFPDDLVPEEMRLVRVDPTGLFRDPAPAGDPDEAANADGSGSAEVAYRQAVRRFARRLEAAEARLEGRGERVDEAAWRAVWAT